MKKINKIMLILTSIIILLPMAYGVMVWDRLPEQVAIHFDVNNVPNGWASRGVAVFGLPIFMLVIYLIAIIATENSKRRENIDDKMMAVLMWSIPAISVITSFLTYGYALGSKVKIGFIVTAMLGVLFMVLGNYMPKCKTNGVVGIRIPSTFSSTENWNRTHRLAGFTFTIGGAALLVSAYFENWPILLIIILAMTLIPIIYSIYYQMSHK